MRVSDIYDALMVHTGYLKALEDANTVEAEGRIENLLEFKSVIYNYEKDDPQLSLSDFMEKIALVAEVDNLDNDEDAIVLMTMHSAKGLEFPVVFMPGMEDGLFPGWRALEKPTGLEEERRLCYVGMTRAKERLFMTSAQMRTLYGKTDYTRESQFMKEIDRKLITGDAIFEKKSGGFGSGSGGWSDSGSSSSGSFGGSTVGNSWGGSSAQSTGNSWGSRPKGGNDGYAKESPYMPFDKFGEAKREVKQSGMSSTNSAFNAGDRVNHAKFGQGMVVEVDGKTISVMFDAVGLKKLAKDIAPIKKIEG